VKGLPALLLLASCAKPAPPVAQLPSAHDPRTVAARFPADHPHAAAVARIAEALRKLSEPNDDGPHGPYHRADDKAQEALWSAIASLAVIPDGDHLLLAAVDRVYTRYDRNYWTGLHFHWPYLCSSRAIRLCDKLLTDYPASALAERALYLKGYALRLPAVEPDHEAEEDRTTYREQRRWTPDFDAARAAYKRLLERFPDGRHARVAKVFASQAELSIELPKDPMEPDPKEPVPLDK
jgi:hypothetical protein